MTTLDSPQFLVDGDSIRLGTETLVVRLVAHEAPTETLD